MWEEGVFEGFWWQAKVYIEGSAFGINEGRVSILSICDGEVWDSKKCVYNYSRGLDFDNCPPGVLAGILEYCESL